MPSYVPLHHKPRYVASLPSAREANRPLSPRYGSPDFDPDEPYRWTRQGAAMAEEQETFDQAEDEEQVDHTQEEYVDENGVDEGNGNGGYHQQDEQAGPSRKRPRTEEEAHPNGNRHQTYQPRGSQNILIIPSIFGISPRNEFTKTVGEFIMANCIGQDHVEVSRRDRRDRREPIIFHRQMLTVLG